MTASDEISYEIRQMIRGSAVMADANRLRRSELKSICEYLGVEYDEPTRAGKLRALILHHIGWLDDPDPAAVPGQFSSLEREAVRDAMREVEDDEDDE